MFVIKKRLQSPKSHDKLQTPIGLNPITYKSSSTHSEILEFWVEAHGHSSFSIKYSPPMLGIAFGFQNESLRHNILDVLSIVSPLHLCSWRRRTSISGVRIWINSQMIPTLLSSLLPCTLMERRCNFIKRVEWEEMELLEPFPLEFAKVDLLKIV